MKKLLYLLCILLILAAMTVPFAVIAAGETLTIRGDGVTRTLTFSRTELEAMREASKEYCYSLSNNFPTDRIEYASGVPLSRLLESAGIRDGAKLITVTASDGYTRTFTTEELLNTQRFYFPESGASRAVPVIVCLKSGETSGKLKDEKIKLLMGQRAAGEQNNPWVVKYLTSIEVSCKQPERWQEVTFKRVSGQDGVTLELMHESFDSVKIYYTTDGTEPTIKSKVYNISASYYQPQLNKPLLITESTVVRAVAIGAGKLNSKPSSITISFGNPAFGDLAGYDWAKEAVESLAAKGIVSGVGNSRFDPAGSLTRGMFVTMLSRTYNQASNQANSSRRFPDVEPDSWYGVHVAWAIDNGVVSGYPDGLFKPDAPLTLEEMIVMAARAGGMNDGAIDSGKKQPAPLKGISGWAAPYAVWAEENGLLTPLRRGGTELNGGEQASRAQAAVILYCASSLSG